MGRVRRRFREHRRLGASIRGAARQLRRPVSLHVVDGRLLPVSSARRRRIRPRPRRPARRERWIRDVWRRQGASRTHRHGHIRRPRAGRPSHVHRWPERSERPVSLLARAARWRRRGAGSRPAERSRPVHRRAGSRGVHGFVIRNQATRYLQRGRSRATTRRGRSTRPPAPRSAPTPRSRSSTTTTSWPPTRSRNPFPGPCSAGTTTA